MLLCGCEGGGAAGRDFTYGYATLPRRVVSRITCFLSETLGNFYERATLVNG